MFPSTRSRPSQVEPAIDELLADAARRLDETIASPEPLHALDTMTERLEYAMNVVRHLESVATTPELRAAFNAVQPKVSAFYSSLPLNEGLWKAIQRYAATAEARSLTGAMKRYLTKTIDSFKRHGADLPADGKARLKEIDVALTEVTTKFSENVLDSTNAYELLIDRREAACGIASRRRGRRARVRGIQGQARLALHAARAQLRGADDLSGRRRDSRAGLARLQHARRGRAA